MKNINYEYKGGLGLIFGIIITTGILAYFLLDGNIDDIVQFSVTTLFGVGLSINFLKMEKKK